MPPLIAQQPYRTVIANALFRRALFGVDPPLGRLHLRVRLRRKRLGALARLTGFALLLAAR
jgi:hypothetical protein